MNERQCSKSRRSLGRHQVRRLRVVIVKRLERVLFLVKALGRVPVIFQLGALRFETSIGLLVFQWAFWSVVPALFHEIVRLFG